MLGTSLVLLGLTVALVGNGIPQFQMSLLASSGSFFALAESGNTLYVASSNGGSVLLERSLDRGGAWVDSRVPYPVVAGGAPWDLSAVAADGSELLLTAASGFREAPTSGSSSQSECGRQSTILLASSPDKGQDWNTYAISTPGATVVWLLAAVEGSDMAVAWVQEPVGACGNVPGSVGVIASLNGGQSWPIQQNLTQGQGSLLSNAELQIVAEDQGILVAFEEEPRGTNSSQIALSLFPPGDPSGFGTPVFLNAPSSSWLLQGDPDSSAFLILPTYLVQLVGSTNNTFLALPFLPLQSDAAGSGELPSLVSLVPLGGSIVEVAATMPDGSGVDCWRVDVVNDTYAQTCHVPLADLTVPTADPYPIVALIDGGGYWVAIGSVGVPNCYDGCGSGLGTNQGSSQGDAPVAGQSGTSVCTQGCASSDGLAAYVFNENAPTTSDAIGILGGVVAGVGLAYLGATRRVQRRLGDAASASKKNVPEKPPVVGSPEAELRLAQRDYRRGLLVWLLAWIPLLLVAATPGSTGAGGFSWLVGLSLVGGVLGGLGSIPFHTSTRRRLQQLHQIRPLAIFREDPSAKGTAAERVGRAALADYASWVAGFLMVALFLSALGGLILRVDPSAGYSPFSNDLAPGAYVLLGSVVVVVLLRMALHASLSDAMALDRADVSDGPDVAVVSPRLVLRGRVGAALLVWNPFVGLLIGWTLQPAFPSAPSVLPWAFLPVTLLGMALLWGFYGGTSWSAERFTPAEAAG